MAERRCFHWLANPQLGGPAPRAFGHSTATCARDITDGSDIYGRDLVG